MNFIEAAVAILSSQPGKPLHVEEICRLAVERDLLSRPAKNPLSSMKGRLTTELKRGAESRVDKVGPELWQLRGAVADPGGAVAEHAEVAGAVPEAAPIEEAASQPAPSADAPATTALDDVLAPAERAKRGALPEPQEDPQLEQMWGDELAPVPLGAAHEEFRDAQTADEDRPMLPEIVAPRRDRYARARAERRAKREANRRRRGEARAESGERKEGGRGGERKEGGRGGERKEGGRDGERKEGGRDGERKEDGRDDERKEGGRDGETRARDKDAARSAPAKEEASSAKPDGAADGSAAAATPQEDRDSLAEAAYQALSSIKGGQAVQVRQLAQMMRKRKLLNEDPQQVWSLLKLSLLSDERRYRQRGLRPRIVYKGRGLFALAEAPGDATLSAAERELERATASFRKATLAALGKRLQSLSIRQLERVVHLYLQHTGWTEVAWIKRVDKYTSYALSRPREAAGKVLVGIHAGKEPVSRRGVGELRVGVEAKKVPRGLLIAPSSLSSEASAEAGKAGAPLGLLCGDAMVSAFAREGIGLTSSYVPVEYLDDELFHELDNE